MAKNVVQVYYDKSYPTLSTKSTFLLRRKVLWQLWRFVVLNLKIMRLIVGGHS